MHIGGGSHVGSSLETGSRSASVWQLPFYPRATLTKVSRALDAPKKSGSCLGSSLKRPFRNSPETHHANPRLLQDFLNALGLKEPADSLHCGPEGSKRLLSATNAFPQSTHKFITSRGNCSAKVQGSCEGASSLIAVVI